MYLREAGPEDEKILLQWANDPLCRDNSFSTETISESAHKEWYRNSLNNSMRKIYILEKEEPIGQVRLDFEEEKARISYSIDARYRGQGLGKRILILLEEKLRSENKYVELKAEVKITNMASQKVFESLNYHKTIQEDMLVYTKKVG